MGGHGSVAEGIKYPPFGSNGRPLDHLPGRAGDEEQGDARLVARFNVRCVFANLDRLGAGGVPVRGGGCGISSACC